MKKPLLITTGAGLLLALAAAAVLLWPTAPAQAASNQPQQATASNDVPAFITDLASWQHNGENGRYYAPIIDGATPAQATLGTVKTDTDCTPDQEGLSHCHNVIELLSGGTITIQDNHNMMINRCLSPGEQVTVTPLHNGWVKLHTRNS